ETHCAVAVFARPCFGPAQIAVAASRVSILYLEEFKILFPVRSLFGKRRWTIAHLDPLYAIVCLTSLGHISKVFIACNRAPSERFVLDCLEKRTLTAGLYFGGNEVSHGGILVRNIFSDRASVNQRSCINDSRSLLLTLMGNRKAHWIL